ncbi:MAG TPA: tetratricopeptide repeat protein, partial [Pontiella sp.]|nr:tetratricopeptide repeat protein [Pontiella sp.]
LAAVAVGPLLCAGRSVKEMAVDVGQEGAGATGSAFANAGVSGMTAVSSGLLAVGDANYRPPASSSTGPSWIKKTGAWLLAAGYFGAVVFCLQIMSSSYIRVLGDRVAQSPRPAPGAMPHAQRFYEIAVKIDPQNWRGYKGMGNLMFGNRYYSLEMDEKIRFAGQERGWYEKAYEKNPKDPEICMAYGKVLIFLGKNQGTGNSAPGTGVDGGTTALSSYGKKDSAERMAQDVPPAGRSDGGTTAVSSVDIGDDVPPDSGQKPIRQQPADGRQRTEDGVSQQPTPTSISKPPASEATDNLRSKSSTSNQLQDRGLELLREACRYRPFNDGYWWNLGVELRKAGRYAEALEVFRRAAEINRTPSTLMNIEWLLARLKALNERDRTVDDLPLQAETSKINTRKALLKESTAPGLILDVSGRAADPGLMDLLDRMGEKEK